MAIPMKTLGKKSKQPKTTAGAVTEMEQPAEDGKSHSKDGRQDTSADQFPIIPFGATGGLLKDI